MNTTDLRFRSNRVRDIIGLFHEELDSAYGSNETGVFVEMLFEALLEWDRTRLMISKEETVNQSDLLRFHWALEDLKKKRPIQHIIGYCDFCGCRIGVNPDVLIPRPETEEMVQWVIELIQQNRQPRLSILNSQFSILDLCTGSGCIAIALKKAFPEATVSAVDISEAALETARHNAGDNNVEINIHQADILDSQFSIPNSQFSILISNPPYVRDSERKAMCANVLDYEPAMALFVPDEDPLRFYHAIAQIAQRQLAENGLLVVEINEALGEATCNLLRKHGFFPTLHTDFRGKKRFITAVKNNS